MTDDLMNKRKELLQSVIEDSPETKQIDLDMNDILPRTFNFNIDIASAPLRKLYKSPVVK